jgi:hypothetical protein
MSSDLSIGAVASSPAVPTTGADKGASAPAASPPSTPANAPGTPNPTLLLDAALGLVVVEFVSKSGAVTSSIPSQRQLAAYRNGTAEPPGQQPHVTVRQTA